MEEATLEDPSQLTLSDFVFFIDLPPRDRAALMGLSNTPSNGDLDDRGVDPGSSFRLGLCNPPRWVRDRALLLRGADGSIVAWLRLRPIAERAFDVGVYVHPEYRRHGLGRRLIEGARMAARQFGCSQLWAYPWNQRSLLFYRSVGFEGSSNVVTRRIS